MDYNEIRFEFIENDSIGLGKGQIEYIKKLIIHYIEKYPLVVLKKVCDFFSWDYMKSELDEYTYTHNRDGDEYIKYEALAKYNDGDKLIGFNHIRLSKKVIKSLYEKFKYGFEDIQEFIAECFMASELTNEVTLANKVKERINEVAGL